MSVAESPAALGVDSTVRMISTGPAISSGSEKVAALFCLPLTDQATLSTGPVDSWESVRVWPTVIGAAPAKGPPSIVTTGTALTEAARTLMTLRARARRPLVSKALTLIS